MPDSKRKLIDLTGQVFGRLTVVREVASTWYSFYRAGRSVATKQRRRFWECLCECGTLSVVTHGALKKNTTSCGCVRREKLLERSVNHGLSNSPEHRVWTKMRGRCNNPNSPDAPDYGERGIKVCEQWDSFEVFYADMGARPTPKHSIERIDNDKGYSPDNCKWATPREQANNKRNNIVLTFQGQTHTLAEWSRIQHINYPTLRARIQRYGWTAERALTVPARPLTRQPS